MRALIGWLAGLCCAGFRLVLVLVLVLAVVLVLVTLPSTEGSSDMSRYEFTPTA